MPHESGPPGVVLEFLRRYFEDRRRGEVRTLEVYQRAFPGYEEAIAREFADLADDSLAPGAPSSGDAIDTSHTASPALACERVGPYRLLEVLGEGGMGIVYLAEQDEPVKRRVALKLIKPGMDTRQVLARFEGEQQALALLDHPNIAKLYEAGTTGSSLLGRAGAELPYFVMEYVLGLTLNEYSDSQCLSIRERLELFLDVCSGVGHAHGHGIIHRDLKPSNILVSSLDDLPVVKIIDFGVAKSLGSRLTATTLHTEFGMAVGTPTYMSPEQAALGGDDIDERSDIFSLGVVLYELLVGAPPPRRSAAGEPLDEVLRQLRAPDFRTPSSRWRRLSRDASRELAKRRRAPVFVVGRQLRGDLDWITMKALEKDRKRRYSSASEFASDIERYLKHELVFAGPPRFLYRAQKFVRRHWVPVAALVAVVLALSAGLVASLLLYVDAQTSLREARRQTYYASLGAATAHLEAGNLAEARRQLEACPEEFRGWEWRHVNLGQDLSLRTIRGHAAPVTAVGFTFDGKRILSRSRRSRVWDAETGSLLTTLETGWESPVALHPDGKRLAVAGESDPLGPGDRDAGRPATATSERAGISGLQPRRLAPCLRLTGRRRALVGRRDSSASGDTRRALGGGSFGDLLSERRGHRLGCRRRRTNLGHSGRAARRGRE